MMLLGLAVWWGWLPAAVVGWALACRLICLWLHWHQPARPCQTKEKATNPTNPTNPTTDSTEQHRV